MTADDKRAELEQWGFTPEEIDFILDPAYLEANRRAKAKTAALEDMVAERTAEINRLLAPVGLRYDVRDLRAE